MPKAVDLCLKIEYLHIDWNKRIMNLRLDFSHNEGNIELIHEFLKLDNIQIDEIGFNTTENDNRKN